MNEIVKVFEDRPVRIVEMDGEPCFVGKDVCTLLGYTNPNKAMNDHCKGITKRYPLQTSGGLQELRVLSESDVMRLICGSKLPEAVRFERWVFESVLPSIRKTGAYLSPAMTDDQMKSLVSTLEQEIYRRIDAENRLAEMERRAEQLAFQAIPKTPFGEVSRLTGRPRTRLIQNYLRSEREVKPKHFSDYVQLLLPLYASRELLAGLVEQYPMLEPAE